MSLQVCRFETGGRREVGLLSGTGTVTPMGVGSMAELLQLTASADPGDRRCCRLSS
jgi:hypothetical protein